MKIGNRIIVELTDSPDRSMQETIIETNACIISAALAQSDAPVVLLDGRLTLITAGQRVLVNIPILQQLIDDYLCVAVAANHGTIEAPHWVLEGQTIAMRYLEDVLRRILAAKEKREGGLRFFVPQVRAIDLVGERAVA
jgi:hypothetical protein